MRALGAMLAFGIAAALTAADRKAPPWEKSRIQLGQELFRENCIVCHDIDKPYSPQSKKPGPSLHHLFKNERLPLSRGKTNRPYVTVRIKFGGLVMPAFKDKMTDAEINLLLDYLASQ